MRRPVDRALTLMLACGVVESCAIPPAVTPGLQESEAEFAEDYGPGGGDFLLSLNGQFADAEFDSQATDTQVFQVTSGVSYFLARAHEVGLELAYQEVELDEVDVESDSLNLSVFYNINFFSSARTSFFIGPIITFVDVDTGLDSDSATMVGAHAGMRHWLSPRAAITVEPRFLTGEFDDDLGGDTDQLFVLFGLSVTL